MPEGSDSLMLQKNRRVLTEYGCTLADISRKSNNFFSKQILKISHRSSKVPSLYNTIIRLIVLLVGDDGQLMKT